jgi:hypothetical protein
VYCSTHSDLSIGNLEVISIRCNAVLGTQFGNALLYPTCLGSNLVKILNEQWTEIFFVTNNVHHMISEN